MKRALLCTLLLMVFAPLPLFAQQDIARCATVTVSRATQADVPALASDVDCFRRAAKSAIDSIELRTRKLIELSTAAPAPAPGRPPAPPPPVAQPGKWEPTPTPTGQPGIPAENDIALGLQPSWGSGVIPGSSAPDLVGAFRMTCAPGDLAYVDTIQYPGSDRLSHLHLFYGLVGVQPNDTYQTALAAGRESTCGSGPYVANRSQYWMPALLDGRGHVFQPNYVSIYYKRFPKTSPYCNRRAEPRAVAAECRNMPQGMKMIAGRDMQKPGTNAEVTRGAQFYCINDKGTSAVVDSLTILVSDPACQGETKLYQVFDFPECWDGKNLDSPNHRDHVAYVSYGSWGYPRCPDSHPYLIPALHVAAEFQLMPSDERRPIRLASDMFPQLDPGKSQHGDAYIAWDPKVFQMMHDNCIDKQLNCSGGDLGNGLQIKPPEFPWVNPHRLVPVPPRPGDAGADPHAGHS